jgi:lipoprotein-anchoring transpeptidase ErfK/SrfK
MKHRSFVLLAVFLALLIFGTVAVYAYDSARDDLIADGVTVAGVDVGGMRASEARAMLRDQLAVPLERPLTIRVKGRRFRLSAARARLRTDVGGMVSEALDASREGNLVQRAWRGLTAGEIDKTIPARVTYSDEAVDRMVARVKKSVDRPAQDARVEFSDTGLSKVPGHEGLAVRGKELGRKIRQELVLAHGDRSVVARTKVTKPKVTTDQLAARYPAFLAVDRDTFKLRFFKNLELKKTFTVAVGAQGFDTPAGLYHIQNKQIDPAWHVPDREWAGKLRGKVIPGGRADNPLKARWMGIFDGAGIHGTNDVGSLGSRASHGCVRMAIPDVIALYPQVPVGAPVYIG